MSETPTEQVPQEGDVIAGKYQVERVLGVGGMGVVVAARHMQLDEKVALKFLLPEAARSADVVGRFEREARAASKIKNEHVARVRDVGTLENGAPYMVMEHLTGSDLSAWLEQRGPMSVEVAVDFVLQACEAIGEAHSIGIVHRDLKPANLFCIERTDGQLFIKVLDFGISKFTPPGAESHQMTRTKAILGTPLYMSPEQMQASKGVDSRTDIWSLGVILFELVTGHAPFNAETVTELAIQIATAPAISMRTLRPDVPSRLERVVGQCLEKDRARRFQTIGELALALQDLAPAHARLSVERVVGTERRAGMPSSSRGSLPMLLGPTPPLALEATTAAPISAAQATGATWGQTGGEAVRGPGRRTGSVIAVAGGVAAIVGVGVMLALRAGGSPVSTPAAASVVATTEPVASVGPVSPPEKTATVSPSSSPAPAVPDPSAVASAAVPASSLRTSRGPLRANQGSVGVTAPRAAHAANCTPPYTVNAAGEHQYKPECL